MIIIGLGSTPIVIDFGGIIRWFGSREKTVRTSHYLIWSTNKHEITTPSFLIGITSPVLQRAGMNKKRHRKLYFLGRVVRNWLKRCRRKKKSTRPFSTWCHSAQREFRLLRFTFCQELRSNKRKVHILSLMFMKPYETLDGYVITLLWWLLLASFVFVCLKGHLCMNALSLLMCLQPEVN